MTNGDKLIASILELEKIKRVEKQQQEKKIYINNLIIKALEKQIKQLEKEKQKHYERVDLKMKIKHIRTVYSKKLKTGRYSTAKNNIEVTENFVTLDFYKSFTSDENIKYFKSRVSRTYEKIGLVPTALVMYSPDNHKYVDEFVFLD